MLNRSYGRGVCDALRQAGLVKFANDEVAGEAADLVSDAVLPEEMPEEVAPETTAALAANLAELATALDESAGHAGAAAEEAAKAASTKNASAWLRRKLAEGSTITGTNPGQENTLVNSDQGEAVLDAMNRPGGDNYANVGVAGVGNQEASGEGAIGEEKEHPGTMGPVAVNQDNSAIDATKNAAAARLLNLVNKLAEGSTITGTDPTQKNTLAIDGPNTGEGQLEAAKRPDAYALEGVGNSPLQAKERAAQTGMEEPHPGQEMHSGATDNSVITQAKSAAEREYLQAFQTVANKYASYLPPRLSDSEKIAAVKYLLSLDPISRDKVAMYMDKTAELPSGLAEYVEKEKEDEDEDGDDEKKETKKEEKKEEEKEASVRDILSLVQGLTAR